MTKWWILVIMKNFNKSFWSIRLKYKYWNFILFNFHCDLKKISLFQLLVKLHIYWWKILIFEFSCCKSLKMTNFKKFYQQDIEIGSFSLTQKLWGFLLTLLSKSSSIKKYVPKPAPIAPVAQITANFLNFEAIFGISTFYVTEDLTEREQTESFWIPWRLII